MALPSIRLANVGDLKAIAGINAEVQGLHFASRPDQFKLPPLSEIEQWLTQLLQEPAARLWAAEISSAVIGYALVLVRERPETTYCPARKWWDIDQMGVQAVHRGTGVGRALVSSIVSQARADGIAELELSSWIFNQNARDAFVNIGFAPKVMRFELRVADYEPDAPR